MNKCRLIIIKCNKTIVYTCAVYGNDYDKILEKIADKFNGICYFTLEGYYIMSRDDIYYDVKIKDIDNIFLS